MELNVALVQTALDWEDPVANRARFDAFLHTLQDRPDLVILPEMFTSGFTMDPGNLDPGEAENTLSWMRQKAATLNAALTGSMVWPLEEGVYANRLIFMRPDGSFQYYDKRHTFTLAGEDQVYRRGKLKEVWDFRGFRICPQICYDLRFPVFSRNTEDYDVLLYVANWPDTRVEAWDTLLKARAIENMAFTIGVNRIGEDPNGLKYTGHTAAFDPLGARLAYSEQAQILEVTMDRRVLVQAREKLRFLQDRDPFTPGW